MSNTIASNRRVCRIDYPHEYCGIGGFIGRSLVVEPPIGSVAIIGVGKGSGIAQKSAQEQFDVQMVDRESNGLNAVNRLLLIFLMKRLKGESS